MTSRGLNLGSLRVGVMQFPGSNCDTDCLDVLERHFQIKATPVWYQTAKLPTLDAVVVPGGFSFGDYLRSGALASHAPIMQEVKTFAEKGGAVIGICNGFQILVESKILPGMLLHNDHLKFVCKPVWLKDASGKVLQMPIAHGEGRYYVDAQTLKALKEHNQIAYRYCDESGEVSAASNPNGALENIAGIFSRNQRVLGMMPHPERATDAVMGGGMMMNGSADGLTVWQEFLSRV